MAGVRPGHRRARPRVAARFLPLRNPGRHPAARRALPGAAPPARSGGHPLRHGRHRARPLGPPQRHRARYGRPPLNRPDRRRHSRRTHGLPATPAARRHLGDTARRSHPARRLTARHDPAPPVRRRPSGGHRRHRRGVVRQHRLLRRERRGGHPLRAARLLLARPAPEGRTGLRRPAEAERRTGREAVRRGRDGGRPAPGGVPGGRDVHRALVARADRGGRRPGAARGDRRTAPRGRRRTRADRRGPRRIGRPVPGAARPRAAGHAPGQRTHQGHVLRPRARARRRHDPAGGHRLGPRADARVVVGRRRPVDGDPADPRRQPRSRRAAGVRPAHAVEGPLHPRGRLAA